MSDIRNLENEQAIKKMKQIAESIGTCMFCTKLVQPPFNTRPMTVSHIDDNGNLWFISSAESNKNMEIIQNDTVQLIFSEASSSTFMSIYGEADILSDKKSIEAAWTPLAKAWFKEGKESPDLSVIKIHPSYVYYWDTKDGKIVTLLKIAAAAVSGNHSDVGVEGQLSIQR